MGLLLARIDSAGTAYYFSHDALGSIIGANAEGAVYKSFLYSEFGDSLGAWGATSINNYRYTGQEWDITPVNAYNLRAREYYPKLGRFMQNDPIGDKGGSLNWYTYVANNPINDIDPIGLFSCTPCVVKEEIQMLKDEYNKFLTMPGPNGNTGACGDRAYNLANYLKPKAQCCTVYYMNWPTKINIKVPVLAQLYQMHAFVRVECLDNLNNKTKFILDPTPGWRPASHFPFLPGQQAPY